MARFDGAVDDKHVRSVENYTIPDKYSDTMMPIQSSLFLLLYHPRILCVCPIVVAINAHTPPQNFPRLPQLLNDYVTHHYHLTPLKKKAKTYPACALKCETDQEMPLQEFFFEILRDYFLQMFLPQV